MLGVEMQTTIKTLFEKGYNKSQIAQMLNVDRKTVRKILKELDENGVVERKERISILDPFKEFAKYKYQKNYLLKGYFKIFLRKVLMGVMIQLKNMYQS